MTASTATRAGSETAYAMEAAIGRLLVAGTWIAMALVAIGVVLTLTSGVDPLDHGAIPAFNLRDIPAAIVALRPEGFLWAGILLVIALPIGRVAVAGLGFVAARDWRLALISLLVLIVVLISVAAATTLEA